ncbi:MAG: ComEC/Rec2 family competence protein [Ruminococcaceae bacterium]|nr:ComEC/Rec2 family competence protein [Oscillospiraceae bacterium]
MLKNRLFVQITIALLFGITFGTLYSFNSLITLILTVLNVLFLISSFILHKKMIITDKTLFIFSLLICFLFGYLYSSNYCKLRFSDKILKCNDSEKVYNIEGVITEKNSRYTDVKVLSGDLSKGICIRIYNLDYQEKGLSVKPFQKGKFSLTLSPCPNYIKADGISFYGKGYVFETEKYNGYYVSKAAYLTRTFLSENIKSKFSENPETAAFINAIILGDTAELSDKVYSDYGRLGITHIISVSGLHFTIIVTSLLMLLQFLNIKMKVRSFICIPFAIFYCILSGSSPSAIRALIMITIFLFGRIILWRMDNLTSIFTAALIISIVNPYSVYSTSFILSFLATFAIIVSPSFLGIEDLYHKPKHIKRINKAVQSLFITLIISMFITPVLYQRFQTLSLITPIANLLLSVFFTLLMYISLFCVIISPFDIPEFLTKAVSFFIDGFHEMIHKFASIKKISIVPSESLITIILILVITCTLATFLLKKKSREITVKATVILSVLSVALSVMISSVNTNKYNRIICSKDGASCIVISDGELYFFVENENYIDSDFLISNNYLDITALVIMDTTDSEQTAKQINKFINICKFDIVYANENIKIKDDIETKKLNEFFFTDHSMTDDSAVVINHNDSKSFLWLSDKANSFDCNTNYDKVIISKSFIKDKTNVRYLPDYMDEIYIPKGFDDQYIVSYIKKNYSNTKLFYIDDFEYKIKN